MWHQTTSRATAAPTAVVGTPQRTDGPSTQTATSVQSPDADARPAAVIGAHGHRRSSAPSRRAHQTKPRRDPVVEPLRASRGGERSARQAAAEGDDLHRRTLARERSPPSAVDQHDHASKHLLDQPLSEPGIMTAISARRRDARQRGATGAHEPIIGARPPVDHRGHEADVGPDPEPRHHERTSDARHGQTDCVLVLADARSGNGAGMAAGPTSCPTRVQADTVDAVFGPPTVTKSLLGAIDRPWGRGQARAPSPGE